MATLVIFGASGDLTKRKLIPALFQLFVKERLPDDTRIVGVSRTEWTDEAWRESLAESTKEFAGELDREKWDEFSQRVFYRAGDLSDLSDMESLCETLNAEEPAATRIFYLATAPSLYAAAIENLGKSGLTDPSGCPCRIVIEKPFGVDLKSARELNEKAHAVFREDQIYRIDHYLGKETVQNLMVLRFANSIFEPIWNRNYINHVQITVAESVAVGDRGPYYDKSGVLRDMFQNHLLQLLMITAMEAPVRFSANDVRDEKVKVLRAIRRLRGADFARDTMRAQYEGYRQEKDVPDDSETATFAALKLNVDSWRWKGVPFYLRSGKAMSCRTTQIVIQFREPPHLLFDDLPGANPQANRLVIQVQPAEGIELQMQTKVPDAGMRLRSTNLDFRFSQEYDRMPDAYQRLLMDVIQGDPSLFARSDEVELAWGIIDPILAAWDSPAAPPLETYPLGYWGPESCNQWMQDQGRQWFDVCPVLHPEHQHEDD